MISFKDPFATFFLPAAGSPLGKCALEQLTRERNKFYNHRASGIQDLFLASAIKKWKIGVFLVAHWWRVCLSMQETWVWTLVSEDLTVGKLALCIPQLLSLSLEPGTHNCWAHMPQLLKSVCLRANAPQEKPLQWEACVPQWRVALAHHN